MKKSLFLLLVLMAGVNVWGQEEPIQFDEVIKVEGKGVQELYTTIKLWVATNYNSAQDVIQMDDPESGILVCKGAFDYDNGGGMTGHVLDGVVHYTLKVAVREGRYKVTVGMFSHEATTADGIKYNWSMGAITTRERAKPSGAIDRRMKKAWEKVKIECKLEAEKIINGLKAATSQGAGLMDTDDDW